ncbi:hypothetical protein TSOC_003540 [Tetrabaena socialis]|uniref:Uncharacterized protein n=1 Tax=Tetrabaena socialis TaxID=47790 RepID=A0A2J8ABC8_9CHLO|nr:hypothetical protein TSOC_003540 [Tetrabaena socialis]|eukprot:PNH09828.1 hypothetical protein TSOC_003540 [Tetrabaena socialis]
MESVQPEARSVGSSARQRTVPPWGRLEASGRPLCRSHSRTVTSGPGSGAGPGPGVCCCLQGNQGLDTQLTEAKSRGPSASKMPTRSLYGWP